MLPRFMWAVGYRVRALEIWGGGKSLIKVAEIFIDAAQVHMGSGVIGFEL